MFLFLTVSLVAVKTTLISFSNTVLSGIGNSSVVDTVTLANFIAASSVLPLIAEKVILFPFESITSTLTISDTSAPGLITGALA